MRLQIVAWPEDRKCERDWLLEKVAGATGIIVMLSDKVGLVFIPLTPMTDDEWEHLF
jgi:hypothetical protein